MTERRAPYRTRRRRPLEPRAPARRTPPQDERMLAEHLLANLTTYYGAQGWRGVDGALAGRCRITIRALLGALEAAQRRQATSQREGNAP